jgi:hypothetical protein
MKPNRHRRQHFQHFCRGPDRHTYVLVIVIVIGGLKSMGLTNHHQDKELQHVVPNYHGLSMFRDGHNIQVSQLMLEVTLFRVTFHIN